MNAYCTSPDMAEYVNGRGLQQAKVAKRYVFQLKSAELHSHGDYYRVEA